MTAAEWASSADPVAMWEHIRWTATDRQVRLFAIACARQIWDIIPPGELRDAVELAERCAEGEPFEPQLSELFSRLYFRCNDYAKQTGRNWFSDTPLEDLGIHFTVVKAMADPMPLRYTMMNSISAPWTRPLTGHLQPGLLRDILGTPYHPVKPEPTWFTPAAVTLARTMYVGRAFDRMPELAAILEQAGCDHADILAHCRGDGPHVRGCWVVDLVLGMR